MAKKLTSSVPISIRVTRPQYTDLDALRVSTGLTMREIIRRAIDEHLSRWRDHTTALQPRAKKRARA